MSETLKAWCHWKRKEVGATRTMIDREGEIELVQAIEDVISQVGTWKAKYEKLREENERMKAVVAAARHIKETWDITDVSGVVPKLHPNELRRNDSLAAGAIIFVIEALKALDETGKGSAG